MRTLSIILLTASAAQAFLFGGGGSSCGCAAPPACPPPPPPPVCASPCPSVPACGGGGYQGGYAVSTGGYAQPQVSYGQSAPSSGVFQPKFGAEAQLQHQQYQQALPHIAPQPYAPQQQQIIQTYQPQPIVHPAGPSDGYVEHPQAIEKSVTEEAVYDEISNTVAAAKSDKTRVKRDNEQAFDPKCNSEVLKNIILKNIHQSTATAKRQIQQAASEEIGGRVDVICSSGTFSYIVNTELYCETEKNGTTCFAFRQSA